MTPTTNTGTITAKPATRRRRRVPGPTEKISAITTAHGTTVLNFTAAARHPTAEATSNQFVCWVSFHRNTASTLPSRRATAKYSIMTALPQNSENGEKSNAAPATSAHFRPTRRRAISVVNTPETRSERRATKRPLSSAESPSRVNCAAIAETLKDPVMTEYYAIGDSVVLDVDHKKFPAFLAGETARLKVLVERSGATAD